MNVQDFLRVITANTIRVPKTIDMAFLLHNTGWAQIKIEFFSFAKSTYMDIVQNILLSNEIWTSFSIIEENHYLWSVGKVRT